MTGLEQAYETVFTAALVFLGVMLLLCLIRAVRGPRVADRLVAVNMMGTMVMVMIAILALLMKEGYLAFLGSRTEEVIRSYFVDTVIFSCKALDENWGVMESQEAFGTAKRAMLDSGRKKILVVDNTKFDQTAFSVADCGMLISS